MALASIRGLDHGGRRAASTAPFGMSPNDAKRMDPQIKMISSHGRRPGQLEHGVFTGQQVSSIAGWRPPFGATSGDVPASRDS